MSANRFSEYLRLWLGGADSAWREALGDTEAVLLGRVRPKDPEEWQLVIAYAVKHGLRVGYGWRKRWTQHAERYRELPPVDVFEAAYARQGVTLDELLDAIGRFEAPILEAHRQELRLVPWFITVQRMDARLSTGTEKCAGIRKRIVRRLGVVRRP